MNTWSIPPIAITGITLYVGFYHLSIYARRKQHREDLTFALMCLSASLYSGFCAGLYSATSVYEGVQWQRAQFIALALFTSAFLAFAFDYTHQKPSIMAYGLWAFYLVSTLIQAIDRTALTWITEPPSIKVISLLVGPELTYYEATFGPFTTVQSFMGLVAGAQIVWSGVSYYRSGHRQEARPLLLALGLMYAAAVNDTAVSNGLYPFFYALEYVYLAMILLMAFSLSGVVVEAAMTREALQKSEERLKLAIEATSDALFDWNMQTGEVYFSPRYYTMLGYEPYEMPESDSTWVSLLHPDDKDYALNTVGEYRQGQRQSHEIETRLRTKSGEWRWILSRGKTVGQGDSGGLFRIIGTHTDITERKQAEQALRRANLIVEGSPVVLFGWKPEEGWPVDYVSANVISQFGYSPEEFIRGAIPFASIVHPDDRGRIAAEVQEHTLKKDEDFEQEYRVIAKNGDTRWVDDRTVVQRDDQGQVTRLEGLVIDITERKKAVEALRESETLFRTLVENSPAGIFLVDDSYHFVYANHELGCILGYDSAELVGMDFRDCLDDESREMVADRYVRRQRGEEFPTRYEIGIVRKDGMKRQAELIATAIKDAQGNVRTIGQLLDITEHRQAEAALRQLSRDNEAALRIAHMGRWEFDVSTATFTFNDQYYALHGTTANQMGGYQMTAEEFASRFVYPADAQIVGEEIRLALEAKDPDFQHQTEVRIVRADGEVRNISVWFRVEKDARGQTIRLYGVVQDITERKQAEETLRASEDRLVKAQALAHVGNWEIDLGAQTIWGSDEALRIYGVDQATHVLPLNVIQDCALPEYRPALDEAIRDLVAGKRAYAEEFQIRRLDNGGIRYVNSTAERILDETGRPVKITGVVQDITERKQMELDLQMFQYSIDQASDAIFWHKRDSGLLYVNEQACRSLGYTHEELKQLLLDDFDPIYTRQRWDVEWKRMHRNRRGGENHVETLHRRKDGTIFPVEVTSKHLWFGDRELHVAVVRDISERKKAQQALEASEARFRALVENSPDFIVFLDKDNRIGYVNRVDKEMTPDQMIGVSVIDYVMPEYRALVEESFDQVWRTGKPQHYEVQIYRGNGAVNWMDIHVIPIFEAGKIANLMLVLRNITNRKQAEEALRDSENRLSVIFNQSADLQAVSSVEPDGTFRIVAVNKRYVEAARQHGYDASEHDFVGKTPQEVVRDVFGFDEAIFEYTARYYKQVVETGRPLRYEETLDTPEGRFDGEVVLAPIFDSTNTCRYILYSSRDITERMKADAEIRRLNDELELRVIERTHQLEVTNRELETFAYSVSHDLRAPLRSIDGFSQALLEDYSMVLDQEGQDHLRRVRVASQRMGQLIDDLLMLSRIARQEMRRETVDLSKLAHEIAAELRQADPERSVEFSIAESMRVNGDSNLLRVALSNLLANAWKFTGKCSQAAIRFYETVQAGERVFAIQDNGAGFDMKYADKLFGAFQRLHQKSEYEGTGIGLATVQRIIHRHGGRIWAEAAVDQGATFYFTVSKS